MKTKYLIILFVLLLTTLLLIARNNDDSTSRTDTTDKFGTVTDIDGNVYQTIIIGEQEWMVENLKVTKYRNREQIPHLTENDEWTGTNSGAFCVYDNNKTNADTYGNLYNWYAVDDDRQLAPEGWHVPTDDEIIQLEMYLGMSEKETNYWGSRGTNEGSKLVGTADLWDYRALENETEFGTSGFNFLPGGYRRYSNGTFNNVGSGGTFWSSTESNKGGAWSRVLNYDHTEVYRYGSDERSGYSVRCVRD